MKGGTKAIIITVSSICLMLIGCATVPTAQQFVQADYGEYPIDYKEIVKNYCNSSSFFDKYDNVPLHSPYIYYSYRWLKEPYKGYFALFGQFIFGYIVHVRVNVRSRMDGGASFGYKEKALMIKNGKVVGSTPLGQMKN